LLALHTLTSTINNLFTSLSLSSLSLNSFLYIRYFPYQIIQQENFKSLTSSPFPPSPSWFNFGDCKGGTGQFWYPYLPFLLVQFWYSYLPSFTCRVSVEVEKGSSLGNTVSHEKGLICQ
jgi:hypothetical protein